MSLFFKSFLFLHLFLKISSLGSISYKALFVVFGFVYVCVLCVFSSNLFFSSEIFFLLWVLFASFWVFLIFTVFSYLGSFHYATLSQLILKCYISICIQGEHVFLVFSLTAGLLCFLLSSYSYLYVIWHQ